MQLVVGTVQCAVQVGIILLGNMSSVETQVMGGGLPNRAKRVGLVG